jgi:hypothetical protein
MVAQPIGFGAKMSVPQTDIDLMQTLQGYKSDGDGV